MNDKDYKALMLETNDHYLKFHQHLFQIIEQYFNVFNTPAGPHTWKKFKDLKILMPQHFIGFHQTITLMVKAIGIKENGVIFNLSTYQYSDQHFNIDQMANPTNLPQLKHSLWPDKYGPIYMPVPSRGGTRSSGSWSSSKSGRSHPYMVGRSPKIVGRIQIGSVAWSWELVAGREN